MSMASTQPEVMSVTQRCSWKGSMSTIMNHRVSVGWGGVRERGLRGKGHRNLGVNGSVKLYYTSGHAPRVPSALQLIPAHPIIHRKAYLLSYKLITGCYFPRQREMAQGAVLRVWRWRFVYYLILCYAFSFLTYDYLIRCVLSIAPN